MEFEQAENDCSAALKLEGALPKVLPISFHMQTHSHHTSKPSVTLCLGSEGADWPLHRMSAFIMVVLDRIAFVPKGAIRGSKQMALPEVAAVRKVRTRVCR